MAGVLAATYYTGPIRSGLRALKYRHAKAVAPCLATYMERPLQSIKADQLLLVPVPLHRSRLKSRGHNQADLLAAHLGRATGLPVSRNLRRTRATVSQTTLNKQHRTANVTGAFEWSGGSLGGKAVVIIDDVTTTGATISACAAAFKPARPSAVWGLAVAKKR